MGDIPFSDDEATGAPSPILLDLTPTWTTDGTAVVFARTAFRRDLGASPTILYRVDGPGAKPVRVAPVATYPFATYYGLGYAADGRLIYMSTTGDLGDPATGLFELAADARSVRQVMATHEETGPPYLLGVTSGNAALVSYRAVIARFGDNAPGRPCALVVRQR